MVIDPKRETVTLRHVGGVSAAQLGTLLEDARVKPGSDADSLLARAEKLAGEGNQEEAARLYASALESAPKTWNRFARAAEALVVALSLAGKDEDCAVRAHALYRRLTGTAAGANIAATGLGCATDLEGGHPRRQEIIDALEEASRTALHDPALDISDDDRSGIYIALISAREAAKDAEGESRLERAWAAFLEGAAAKAVTPAQRTVYDSHRLSAYLELGTPEKAIPMLEQSARDFPDDYNPHSRMALAYRAMKDYDEALASSARALSMAYGPRKIGFFRTRADVYADMGDRESARKTIEEALRYARSLPKEQVRAATITGLEKKLADLGAPVSSPPPPPSQRR
ncbi:MAG TPA: thiol reductase thioredoxin [Thermoanaerobaculia bacterium]|nr:thiol reductase thioredoxin [Thermoanaerobaculia bacterium]